MGTLTTDVPDGGQGWMRRQYQCFLISLPANAGILGMPSLHLSLSSCQTYLQCILPLQLAMDCLTFFTLKLSPQNLVQIVPSMLRKENCPSELRTRILRIYNFSRKVFRESLRLFITFPGINFPLWKMWIYSEAPPTTDTLAYGDSAILQSLS